MLPALESQFSSLSLDESTSSAPPELLPPSSDDKKLYWREFTPVDSMVEVPPDLKDAWLCGPFPLGIRARLVTEPGRHGKGSRVVTEEGFETKPVMTALATTGKQIIMEGVYVSALNTFYAYDLLCWHERFDEHPYEVRVFLLHSKLQELYLTYIDLQTYALVVKSIPLTPASRVHLDALRQSVAEGNSVDKALFARYSQAKSISLSYEEFLTQLRVDASGQKFVAYGFYFRHRERPYPALELPSKVFGDTSTQGYFSDKLIVDCEMNFTTEDGVIVYESTLIDAKQWRIEPFCIYQVLYEGLQEIYSIKQSRNVLSLVHMVVIERLQARLNRPTRYSAILYKCLAQMERAPTIDSLVEPAEALRNAFAGLSLN